MELLTVGLILICIAVINCLQGGQFIVKKTLPKADLL